MQSKVIVKLRHDKGTVKISVWAESLEQAKQMVCNAEKCPLSSVIYARVARLTISDIKYQVEQKGSYFFSRSSMKFFKQTIKDFSVKRYGDDKFYLSSKYGNGCPIGKTERIFNPFSGELEHI
jgi:hypothetical protein